MTAEPLPPLTVLELPDTPATTRVRVEGDRILVDRLVVTTRRSPRSSPSARPTTGRTSSSAPCGSACSRSRTPA